MPNGTYGGVRGRKNSALLDYGFLEKRSAFLIVRFAARAITVDAEQSVEEVYDLPEKL